MRPEILPKTATITSLVAALFLISACDSGNNDTAQQDAPAVAQSSSEAGISPSQADTAPAPDQAASSTPSDSSAETTPDTESGTTTATATDSTTSSSDATQVAAAGDPKVLIKRYNCVSCHATDKKLLGPAYKEVAAKYKDEAGAADTLVAKVKEGGSGVWGAIPMPPNPGVPDGDVRLIVDWILAGAS